MGILKIESALFCVFVLWYSIIGGCVDRMNGMMKEFTYHRRTTMIVHKGHFIVHIKRRHRRTMSIQMTCLVHQKDANVIPHAAIKQWIKEKHLHPFGCCTTVQQRGEQRGTKPIQNIMIAKRNHSTFRYLATLANVIKNCSLNFKNTPIVVRHPDCKNAYLKCFIYPHTIINLNLTHSPD